MLAYVVARMFKTEVKHMARQLLITEAIVADITISYFHATVHM